MSTPRDCSIDQLSRALKVTGTLITELNPEQYSAPTPCTEWDVRDVVAHLVGMNLIFTALLNSQKPPSRDQQVLGNDPGTAFGSSAAALLSAFERAGALEQNFETPMGSATGQERLNIRMYDLLTHAWDLSQATGNRLEPLGDLAEQSLMFARRQLAQQQRNERFNAAQPVADGAPALDRLAAFLGRPLNGSWSAK
ncbi:TIGR03086 family metal-binding protein [Glutamicibacter ardleyensis]|uniref:TIGR03086 family metal-binding protein n=1 Tax=Glutamicibacter ardleyensis TaxID=225894 RepID=UPI003F9A207C